VSDFVGGDDDAGEAASVLDDGNAVDLLQSLVDDASATDVGETFIESNQRPCYFHHTKEQTDRENQDVGDSEGR